MILEFGVATKDMAFRRESWLLLSHDILANMTRVLMGVS
jgi:hypothetical protein